MIRIAAGMIATFLLLCSTCSGPVAGTETGTHTGAVTGTVLNEDSTGAGAIPVILHLLGGDSAVSFTTATDGNGIFHVDSLTAGDYFAEAVSMQLGAALPFTVVESDTAEITTLLSPTGMVIGKLCIPFLDQIIKVTAKIREINRELRIDSTGYFEIVALPAYNNYTLEFQTSNFSGAAPFKIIDLEVVSGDTVNIGNIALFTGNARIRALRHENDSTAASAEITITGSDILPIIKSAELRPGEVYAAITNIPEGLDRIFAVSVYDSVRQLLSSGADTADISVDSTIEITIGLSGTGSR